jgi:hypothetical protein
MLLRRNFGRVVATEIKRESRFKGGVVGFAPGLCPFAFYSFVNQPDRSPIDGEWRFTNP